MATTDLRAKFNEWIMIFVMVPATIGVGICNLFLWRSVVAAHAYPLNEVATAVSAQFEQMLRTEAIRLKTISFLPNTTSLLGMADRRYALRQHSQSGKLEEAWAASARDDMMVRGVMDNDLGNSFRLLCDQQPHISSFLLTDKVGALLASSDRRPRYYQDLEPWWNSARSKTDGRVVSEGLSQEGLIGLNYARWKTESPNVLHGVLREELKLSTMMQQISIPGLDYNYTVFTLGVTPVQMAGATNLFEATAAAIEENIREHGEMKGRQKGCSYVSRIIDADISWAHPLLVVTARGESAFPLNVVGPMAGGLLVGALAVIGVFAVARGMGRKLFFDPMKEAAEAGVWVLHKAFGDKEASARYAREHPWVKIGEQEAAPVQKELAKWMNGLQQQFLTQMMTASPGVQNDMNLATDFQKVLLNRPYPTIPAVHFEGLLRLEFHHRYRPALPAGSDFFDIEALGSDCAGVFIADVMDHGTRSALISAILRTLLGDLYNKQTNPALFIKELNRKFCESLSNLPTAFFASACFFIANTTSRVATYALAGHPAPYLMHRAHGRVLRLRSPRPRGVALGVLPGENYTSESIRLTPGDLFIFFTDGLYKSCNPKGEEFGVARLEQILRANIQNQNTREILDAVMNEVAAFMDNQPVSDDLCMVAVDVLSSAVKKE